jgi:transcriptional regulator with XRE-family HTH domain
VRHRSGEVEGWPEYVAGLANNLRRARHTAGLSQEDVAYRAGLSRYTYQKFEKGESRPGTAANPTLFSVIALSQALGTTVEQLLPPDPPDLRIR